MVSVAWHIVTARERGWTFTLAAHSSERLALSNTIRVEPEQNQSFLRILHLEDDPLDVELIESGLKENGVSCVITQIYTRETFEAAFHKGRIDLILSDCNLPSFDTLSALKWVREFYPTIPFVFISGTRSPQIKEGALQAGAAAFLDKSDLKHAAEIISTLTKIEPSQQNPTTSTR